MNAHYVLKATQTYLERASNHLNKRKENVKRVHYSLQKRDYLSSGQVVDYEILWADPIFFLSEIQL